MTQPDFVSLLGLVTSGVVALGLGGKGLSFVRAITRGFLQSF